MKMASAVVLLSWVLGPAPAQTRDAPVAPTTGTASVSGIVLSDADPAEPVRRALVTIAGPDLHPSRGAITDDEGRFRIAGLPPGRVTVTATRASFVTSVYGAKRPARPGTAISIGNGETIDTLVVRLWRGAVLTGVIRDETGSPVSGISVTAYRARPTREVTVQTLSNNPAVTNDLGEYRIFGLEPGTYFVAATPASGAGAAITALSDAEVDRALAALRSRQPRASAPGRLPDPVPVSRPFDYAPVYYPGTTSRSEAAAVTVAAGELRQGLDLALQRVATARVEGTVLRPDGQVAASANVQLTEVIPAGQVASDSPLVFTTRAGADGRFRLSQVTPGLYRLVARVTVGPPPDPARAGFASPFTSEPTLSGVEDLTIAGSDMTDLAVQLQPGLTVSGQVRFEGQGRPLPAMSSAHVSLLMPQALALRPGASINSIAFPSPAPVKPDGSFEFANVVPGRYVLRAATDRSASEWTARSAMLGDRDLLDGVIDIPPGTNISGVTVTFSDERTELSGSLQTADGKPLSDVFVLAFTTDRAAWVPFSRRVQAVRPGVDGHFAISGLPAGEYYLAAATDVDEGDWEDPGFLTKLAEASVRVTLSSGEKKVVAPLRAGGR